jgi:PIN domain nuclease of toxin-antitoxin system
MRLLLDTHVLLWAVSNPHRLSKRVHEVLKNPHVVVFVSSVTALEIATKYRIGKLPEAASLVHGYYDCLRTFLAQELPVSSKHALTAGNFQVDHRDPFDRLLAAQSLCERLPLVTADKAFGQFPVSLVW